MIVLTCLDDKDGMMFNHRRQSQDRILREDILRTAGEKKLWLNGYSARQFSGEQQERLSISEDFMTEAGTGEFCFVEQGPLAPVEEKIEQLILYRWNRHYPSDMKLDLPLAAHGWVLRESRDFAGSSHEKITREVYSR